MNRRAASGVLLVLAVVLAGQRDSIRAEEPSDDCYLFSYFKGNGEDGLHLAASRDGFKWTSLNRDRPLLAPRVGRDRLMRDPSIVRAPDGVFHMVWTTSWNDRIIGYAHSKDLIRWSEQRAIPVMMHEPAARNSWAPEVFYDPTGRRYFIVWSTTIPDRFPNTTDSSESRYNHRVYYTTTADFKSFAPTRLFFDPGHNVIDAFLAKAGDRYLLFFKDETLKPEPRKLILLAAGDRPEGPFGPAKVISPENWVEGPSALRIGGTWFVYYDCYRKGRYGGVTSTDLEAWTDVTARLEFPPGARHGTAFQVDRKVLEGLEAISK